ncbi:hypothetical protein FH972_021053 [Carpinus fangiana]|uniref:Uncharacterized protein n=1 Tax=Carpinus fangiana TaxID=176857 RepID=A0A5N6KNF1_9ROSI|nr:hypothetical protein FH972_021053 [Carpinus fangiana]
MAPIRRYLRITKYSVLEVRIYLDDPALAETWLLDPRKDVLARVMQAVRPYVLPKLREENERAKGKGKKAKGVKDVVSEATRHSLLTKQKVFTDKDQKIRSNSGKLTGWVTTGTGEQDAPVTIREESEGEGSPTLGDFPAAIADDEVDTLGINAREKRPRTNSNDATLFVPEDEAVSDDEGFQTQQSPRTKKARVEAQEQDDKKKLGLTTAYEGFSIYGRILCLIVSRRGYKRQQSAAHGEVETGAQQMMERQGDATQSTKPRAGDECQAWWHAWHSENQDRKNPGDRHKVHRSSVSDLCHFWAVGRISNKVPRCAACWVQLRHARRTSSDGAWLADGPLPAGWHRTHWVVRNGGTHEDISEFDLLQGVSGKDAGRCHHASLARGPPDHCCEAARCAPACT